MTALPQTPLACAAPALQRARGVGRARLRAGPGDQARLDRLYQEGAAKIRFSRDNGRRDLILINSCGGLTDGDRLDWTAILDAGAACAVTTQACEKVYRRRPAAEIQAKVTVNLEVGAGGRLDWLPQETILFDGAGLDRRLQADLAADAQLLAVEPVILGRPAMGETVRDLRLSDRWRVRREGRLIFADDLRIEGELGPLAGARALLGGAGAFASVLLAAPDAERKLDAARALLPAGCGASAWDGKLFCRLTAPGGLQLRRILIPLLTALCDGRPLPRLWSV